MRTAMRTRAAWLALLATSLGDLGCERATVEAKAPTAATAAPQGATKAVRPEGTLDLVDVAAKAGIDVTVVCGDPRRWYIPESNGSGAAWLDVDNDGDMDLFVGNGAHVRYVDDGKRLEIVRDASCHLYRNDGGLRFTDVTAETGAGRTDWVNGIATGDVDNDGDVDLYLACVGPDVLLRNDGGKLADATKEAGLGCPLWGASAAFGDADNDGDLDLYVANYCEFDPEHPPAGGKRKVIDGVEVGFGPEAENPGINVGAPDVFYRNDGKGHFTDATKEAGFALPKALCSYGVVFSDVDGDGWQDVLVANDGQPASLFVNQKNGTFKEDAQARGFALNAQGKATSAMGLAVEDFDEDGDMDVFRTNFDMEPNSMHVNDGKGRFTDRAAELGLAAPSVDKLGWGCAFLDVDCDGDLDLLVANGHVYPQAEKIGMHPWAQRTQLYEAVRGADGKIAYRDATERAGSGLAPLRSARGLAIADIDGDGDVDAVVTDLDEKPRLLENRSERRGRWIVVRLVGTTSQREGFGAVVRVTAGGRTWTREMRTTQGLYSSHDPRLHFGLGPVERVDKVEVRWPTGRVQVVDAPPLDALLTVQEMNMKNLIRQIAK